MNNIIIFLSVMVLILVGVSIYLGVKLHNKTQKPCPPPIISGDCMIQPGMSRIECPVSTADYGDKKIVDLSKMHFASGTIDNQPDITSACGGRRIR